MPRVQFDVKYREMHEFPAKFAEIAKIEDQVRRERENSILYCEFNRALDYNMSQLEDVVSRLYSELGIVLASYAEDYKTGETVCLGFRRAPAAKGIHHAYEGGLVQHYLEMLQLADHIQSFPPFAALSVEDILLGVIAHDLHKAYAHYHYCNGKLAYSSNYTTVTMRPNQKTMFMLSQCGVTVNENAVNMIFSSEGGYATDAPSQASVLSKFVYLLDEQSVLVDRIRLGRMWSIHDVDESFFPTLM